jgi:hypothetical protein
MAYTSIDDPEAHFRIKLYAGNGSSDRAIVFDTTDTTMQPNLVWLKNRSSGSTNHAVMGTGLNTGEYIRTNDTHAETSGADVLNSIDSNGFEIGSAGAIQNDSGDNYVAWCWKESADAGFDIVSYTGSGSAKTVSHSLSAVPHVMIVKNRESVESWMVYHHKNTAAPETDYLEMDTNGASVDNSNRWNDTAPTSSVFTVGDHAGVNESSVDLIAYLFAPKQGFSKFGSYTGNGNADGTYVHLGFKPAFFMIKRTTGSGYDWLMYDNKRQVSFNVIDDFLKPNLADAETTGNANQSLDFLSSGVKHRGNGASSNGSGVVYTYMAFAEAPFVNSNGVPCNAR